MPVSEFGRMPDGSTVEAISIAAEGIEARVLTFGATLADLVVATPAGRRSVILGFDDLDGYLAHGAYFGAIAGRCANRIAGGRFSLDGIQHQLDVNEAGRTHLHGGGDGFFRRNWTIVDASENSVLLGLTSPDGDQGYPGRVIVTCRYSLDKGRLRIALGGRTDAPTLMNLAPHAYFNLDGSGSILDHRLRIAAEAYTPVDMAGIPTGEVLAVDDTVFDFRDLRPIRNGPDGAHSTYDHNFVLAMQPAPEPWHAARLEGPRSGIRLDLWTTEPGLQFYDGAFLPVAPLLRGGIEPVRFGALCLEPQRFPDAANHPHFPSTVLRPDEIYSQVTEYRFSTVE
ncbi:aldose epimerase [Aminobacter sp. DSM 101952]|uniref:aldose epimerase family protein n=1 Tax=Aminobacter sp. DSM 101952 TaxID=2735891 RepID=UPI0006FD8946|nr:aldose epimerase family protein [Aminobacter sp. DSM 101952]KQU64743.1 aldose epimerase [Aminobacter sp. DSM 101952]